MDRITTMRSVFCLPLVIILFGCPQGKKEAPPVEEPPSTVIDNFNLIETNQGRKMWVLQASKALVYQSKERIVVEAVAINFFNVTGELVSNLVAPTGELNTKNRNMTARGGVVVKTQDSTTLNTDSLFWQNDSARIITRSRVLIVRRDQTKIEGMGLVTDPELKKIEILGRISGESSVEIKK